MTTTIVPDVIDDHLTQPLEDTPMTPAEQRKLVELETRIKTKLGNKMEADLAIGGALLQIQRERLYRSPQGGRKFETYIKEESHRLTPDGQPIGEKTAAYLRGFYYFREEVLTGSRSTCSASQNLPLPTAAAQVRPLLFLLDHLRRDANQLDPRRGGTYDDRRAAEAKAIEIWKAAVTEAKGKTPSFDQVNRARLADEAAEQHRLRGRADSTPPSRLSPEAEAAANQAAADVLAGRSTPGITPPPSSTPDFSPQQQSHSAPAPTIPAWQLEKAEDSALDAGEECKKVSRAINDAHKAIGLLRGILYSQLNKYGSDYLTYLRQLDAGVYSLHTIDDQVQQMAEDIAFIRELLVADVGEGELARSTVDVTSFPTRA